MTAGILVHGNTIACRFAASFVGSLAFPLKRVAASVAANVCRSTRTFVKLRRSNIVCCRLFTLILLGVLIGHSACASSSSAISFWAFGKTEFRFFQAGVAQREVTNLFRVSVRGCSSKIETSDIILAGDVQASNYTYTSDGTNSCFLITIDERSLDRFRKSGSIITASALADLRPDVFPPCHIGFIAPVWLAYASHCALPGAGHGEIPPLVFMGAAWPDYGRKIQASWLQSDAPPRLPAHVVEYADREVFAFVDSLAREDQANPLPALYQSGYTNAIYDVLAWTNVGKLRLPFHSRLTRYIPAPAGRDAGHLIIQLTYDSYLSEVSTDGVAHIMFPESLPRGTRTSDYRFGNEGGKPHVYSSPDGRILSLKQIQALEPSKPGRSVPLVRLFLGLALVSPVIMLLSIKLKKSKQNSENHK
jgi:hypothetical protein